MQKLLTPNVLAFAGGTIAVLVGVLLATVAKMQVEGSGLIVAGAFAMGNALKSVGQVMNERAEKKRASQAPPAS